MNEWTVDHETQEIACEEQEQIQSSLESGVDLHKTHRRQILKNCSPFEAARSSVEEEVKDNVNWQHENLSEGVQAFRHQDHLFGELSSGCLSLLGPQVLYLHLEVDFSDGIDCEQDLEPNKHPVQDRADQLEANKLEKSSFLAIEMALEDNFRSKDQSHNKDSEEGGEQILQEPKNQLHHCERPWLCAFVLEVDESQY